MSSVEVKIGNSSYELVCADGDEERIKKLAAIVDAKFRRFSRDFSSASDNRILAITALMQQDEIENVKQSNGVVASDNVVDLDEEIGQSLISFLEPLVQRVELLAKKVNNQ